MDAPSPLTPRRRPTSDLERLQTLLAPELGLFCIELDSQGAFRQSLCRDAFPGWPEPQVGQSLLAYLPDPIAAEVAGVLEAALRRSEAVSIEFPVEIDGAQRWYFARAFPLADAEGHWDGCLIIGRDVTTQHDALARADVNAQLFRHVVDRSPGVTALVHPSHGITYLNAGIAAALGYAPEELQAWSARELVPDADVKRLEAEVEADHHAGRQPTRTTITARHRDGQLRQLDLTLERLELPDGQARLLVTARDITDQIQAEVDLRQERDLAIALSELGALMNSSLDLGDVLNRVLSAASAVVASDLSSIMLVQGERAVIVANRGLQEHGIRLAYDQSWMSLAGNTHVARVVRERRQAIVRDAAQDPEWTLFYGPSPIRSSLITPIIVKGDVIGLLNVDSVRPDAFGPEDARRLKAFSDQAGIALANARLFEEISAEKDRIGLLYRLQHDLDVTLGRQVLIQRAIAFTRVELLATSAELWLPSADETLPDGVRFDRFVAPGHEPTAATVDAPWVAALKAPLLLAATPGLPAQDGGPNDPRWAELADPANQDAVLACLPLRGGGKLSGAWILRALAPGFPFNDRGLLQALAQALSLALESAVLVEADRERADDLAVLDRLGGALLGPHDVEDLSARIKTAIELEFGVLTAELDLTTAPEGVGGTTRIERPNDIAELTATIERPVVIDDVAAEVGPNGTRWQPRHWAARALAAFPLHAGGRTIGVLVVERAEPAGFSARDRRVLMAFAERAASALHSTQLVAALADDARYLATLNEISRSGLRGSDLNSLLEQISDLVVDLIQADSASITLWDDASQRHLPGAGSAAVRASFVNEIERATERKFSDFIIETGQPMVIPDIASPSIFVAPPSRRLPGKTLLGAPLLLGERVMGALVVAYHTLHAVTSVDLERVRNAAGVVALSIANQQLFDELAAARQSAETANQLKGEFLANTSHELRTPLTGILGALRLVLDDVCEDREEERAFINTAHDAALRLLTHINELLDLSKIEAGQMPVELQTVDVGLVIHQVYELMAPRAAQQGVALNIEDRLEPTTRAVADPEHVRHILLNLVGNALKFTAQGEVRVLASASDGWLNVAVADTGIGIPLEAQTALFKPFVQVDGSSTRQYGGTGLGLAISRRLAEGMGGTLDLFSAGLHQGCTFTVRLPRWTGVLD